MVALGFNGAANLAKQQNVLESRIAEQFLLPQNFRIGELCTGIGDGGIALFDLEKAEQLRSVDNGQQIVDLESKVVGQAVDVVSSAFVEQQFEQAGHASGSGMRQHLVLHLTLIADSWAGLIGNFRRSHVGSGQHLVDVVNQLGERVRFAVARLGDLDPEVGANLAGIAAENDDPIGQQHGFLDIVGDDENSTWWAWSSSPRARGVRCAGFLQ